MTFLLLRKFASAVKRFVFALCSWLTSRIGEISTDKLAANIIGPFSLIFISILVWDVILSLYSCLAKWMLSEWPLWRFSAHWIAAHLVVANIAFHYYCCAFSDPGSPALERVQGYGKESGWCRKCSAVKPPLTHHCSVCKRCVLRMDHHCTWMNNCIGVNNHRHFFLFCFYTCFACLYAFHSGSGLYHLHTLYSFGHDRTTVATSQSSGAVVASFGRFSFSCSTNELHRLAGDQTEVAVGKIQIRQSVHPFRPGFRLHRLAAVALYLCLLVFVLLAFLTLWHTWLISIGHTSIDNMGGATKPLKSMSFHEIANNWRLFLGLNQQNGSFVTSFLLPSRAPGTPLSVWIAKASNKNEVTTHRTTRTLPAHV